MLKVGYRRIKLIIHLDLLRPITWNEFPLLEPAWFFQERLLSPKILAQRSSLGNADSCWAANTAEHLETLNPSSQIPSLQRRQERMGTNCQLVFDI